MTPKIVKVERTQYFDYRPFTPSFMLVNQLEEEARRQERIQEEKEIKENRNNRGLFNFLLLPKRRRNETKGIELELMMLQNCVSIISLANLFLKINQRS